MKDKLRKNGMHNELDKSSMQKIEIFDVDTLEVPFLLKNRAFSERSSTDQKE